MWAVWIALLLWATPIQGVSTHCEIPAVEKLQNTSLTCKFSEDISKLKQDFKVQYYKSNTADSSEVILDCYWLDNRPECTVHKCCQYDGHVTRNLTLRVLSVTEAHAGRYVCFVLPAAPDSYNFCNFTLTEKQTDTPGSNPAAIAVPLVIVIAVIICIIIIVWRLKCNKKTEDKTMKKKTCHFCPVQRYSREKETVDGKFNEGKQSLIECNVEENDSSQPTKIPDSKDRIIEKDLKSTDPMTAEKFGQKSDNPDGSHRHVHTSIKETVVTVFDNLYRRVQVNRNAEPRSTPHQELSIVKIESPSTSVAGLETKPQEIEKGQTDGDKPSDSDVASENALNKPALSESGTNVSRSGINAAVTQSQKMQSPSDQNEVITHIAEQSSDDGTGTTKETSQILRGNELQIENETKEQKTQNSDYTLDINKEGKSAKHVIRKSMKIDKEAQVKSENDWRIAKDKAEKDIQNAREKAEKEEKLVKENAEKDETIAKEKAKKREKIEKEKAGKEERIADDKAKEEEKIAKDKAKKEKELAKRTSKTTASIEEQVKKISNEKEEQMKKIAKKKDELMESIAKEKEEQLEKIAKEKREELEKIENMKDKQLQEISKRKEKEIEEIRKRTDEEMERIANMKEKQLKEITKKKEEELDKIRKENENRMEAEMQKKEKKNESKKKEERKSQKKGKGEKQTTIRESDEAGGSNIQSNEKKIEDDACGVELAKETDPFLTTKKSTTDTVITMNELASHQDTSETPSGTQGQTLHAVDKIASPVKKNNEDIASNGKAPKSSGCAVS